MRRALLLVGFATGLRRAELVGLLTEDLAFEPAGVKVLVRRTKTHPEGRTVGVCRTGTGYCPVAALEAYIAARAAVGTKVSVKYPIAIARLFPVDTRTVANIIQSLAKKAGIEADVSGHSLRAGMITQAAMNGASDHLIADQSGHKSMDMLRRYVRNATLLTNNVSRKLGL